MCAEKERFPARLQAFGYKELGGLPMNMNRPDMTENVKYKDYTNKSLQMDSNLATMEMSKSPAIESSD